MILIFYVFIKELECEHNDKGFFLFSLDRGWRNCGHTFFTIFFIQFCTTHASFQQLSPLGLQVEHHPSPGSWQSGSSNEKDEKHYVGQGGGHPHNLGFFRHKSKWETHRDERYQRCVIKIEKKTHELWCFVAMRYLPWGFDPLPEAEVYYSKN